MKHSKYFTIEFRDVDQNGFLKMNTLVDYMQETSNEHAALLGIDFLEPYEGKQYYWIVSRAKMELETYPKWKETIRIETYPVGVEKLFAVRRFNLFNEKDEQLGYIIGYYILMDAENFRPARFKMFADQFPLFKENYEGEVLDKLEMTETILREDLRKVRSGEIDSNKHMNNAHYIRWSTDLFTCEELVTRPIKSIQTNYITSLLEGDVAKILLASSEKGTYIVQGTSEDQKIIYWTSHIQLHE